MLILDRNNEPTSTVYYLAASIYGYLKTYNGIDASSLYQKIKIILPRLGNLSTLLCASL